MNLSGMVCFDKAVVHDAHSDIYGRVMHEQITCAYLRAQTRMLSALVHSQPLIKCVLTVFR